MRTVMAFFEIAIGGVRAGRMVMELYSSIAPKTVENFRCLCTGERGMGQFGKPLHFKGSPFHRIIPGRLFQGGDIIHGDGTGGESIYDPKFDDEPFIATHNGLAILSMANSGPNTNGSQFFISLSPAPWLDGKHVVFGYVLKAGLAMQAMEEVGSESGATSAKVVIANCGEYTMK